MSARLAPICEFCPSAVAYYRGKNRKPGCLKIAYCSNKKTPERYDRGPHKGQRFIATYRWQITDRIKTSPRWCPLRPHTA